MLLQMFYREITKTIRMNVWECAKMWKNFRDKYVFLLKTAKKEKLSQLRAGTLKGKKHQPLVYFYNGLAQCLKHQDITTG